MSTLEIRASHAPKTWPGFGGFSRFVGALLTVIDVFAEAQRQAHEAQRRFPFTAW
jgi:hypothetical protein